MEAVLLRLSNLATTVFSMRAENRMILALVVLIILLAVFGGVFVKSILWLLLLVALVAVIIDMVGRR